MMGGGGTTDEGDSPAPDPDPPAADTSFYDNERPGLDPAPAPAPPPPPDDGGQDDFTAYEPPSTPQLPDPPQPDPPDPSFPDNERPGLDPNFPDTSPILPDDEDDFTAYEPPNVLQLPPEFLPPDFTDPMNTGGPGQPPSGTPGDSDDFPYDQYEPPVYDNEPTMPDPDPDPSDDPPAPDPQPQPDEPASGGGDVDDDVVRGEEAGNRRRKRPGRAGEGRTIMGSATNYKPTKSVQKKTLLGS